MGGPYGLVAWLQPVRLAAEAGPSQRWSNFRYFRLLPWVRAARELRCVRIGVGEKVSV